MSYRNYTQVKAFNEINCFDFTRQLTERVKSEIEGKEKAYILGVDEEEFKTYLIDRYSLEPLVVDPASEEIDKPSVSKELQEGRLGNKYQVEAYNFTVKYQFTGSAEMFKVRPSSFKMTSTDILVDEAAGIVAIPFKIYEKKPEEFKREKTRFFQRAFANLDNANAFIKNWNNELAEKVNYLFRVQKDKYLQENDFFAAINVKVNQDTEYMFSAPTIKRKVIPQPTVAKNKEFASVPSMSKEMYDDVLKVIYDSGKNMEKKPALYKDKDEEGLRDQFLFVLETRYEGTTATGETFNRSGKTDIILKYANDASNLFVAECKFWHGEVEFSKAISQLFDRYLTWRDSKVALIIFVKNRDFSNVLGKIKIEPRNHPYFVKEAGQRGESSFSYVFHLAQDNDKEVYLEVLAFHYDK